MIAGVLAVLLLGNAAAEPNKDELRSQQLLLMVEFANARADRVRIEKTLQDLKAGSFDAARDETLRQLSKQLDATEQKLAALQRKSDATARDPELSNAIRVRDVLNKKVRAARENLPEFFSIELVEARQRETELQIAIAEAQRLIDPNHAKVPARITELNRLLEQERRMRAEEATRREREAEQRRQQELADAARRKEEESARLKREAEEKQKSDLEKQRMRDKERILKEEIDRIRRGSRPLAPKPGQVTTNQADLLPYVFLPPGTFQMGCVPGDKHCRDDESPSHRVTLTKAFWISRSEVTVGAYKRYVEADKARRALPKQRTRTNPFWKEVGQPISFVSWEDAQAYCAWAGGRLPTESEWEYAARGGKDGVIFPWGSEATHENANYMGKRGLDKYEEVADVGAFPENGWGLVDMNGNVGEWVADYYAPRYDDKPVTDPRGPAAGKHRVIRGGSWAANEAEIRTSVRVHWLPTEMASRVGFRCVIEKF